MTSVIEANPPLEMILASRRVVPRLMHAIAESLESGVNREAFQLVGIGGEQELTRLTERIQEGLVAVSYGDRVVRPWEEIRDALGNTERLTGLKFEGRQAALLLLDPYPGANWGHPCWLATYDIDQETIRWALNDFPPQESLDRRLVPLAFPDREA